MKCVCILQVEEVGRVMISIDINGPNPMLYPFDAFMRLDEWRELQLNKVLNG